MSKKCFQDQKESTKLIEFCVTRTQKKQTGKCCCFVRGRTVLRIWDLFLG